MLPLSNGRIWLYTGNTDMRKQFDGCAGTEQVGDASALW